MQQLSAVELGSSLARAAAWTWLADQVTAVYQHCNPDVNHTEMDLFINKINLDVSMVCCLAGLWQQSRLHLLLGRGELRE